MGSIAFVVRIRINIFIRRHPYLIWVSERHGREWKVTRRHGSAALTGHWVDGSNSLLRKNERKNVQALRKPVLIYTTESEPRRVYYSIALNKKSLPPCKHEAVVAFITFPTYVQLS